MIRNDGTLFLNDSALLDSSDNFNSQGGGAIYNSGNANLDRVGIRSVSSDGPGGAIYNASGGTLSVKNSTIADSFTSDAESTAGGLYNAGTATLEHVTLHGQLRRRRRARPEPLLDRARRLIRTRCSRARS